MLIYHCHNRNTIHGLNANFNDFITERKSVKKAYKRKAHRKNASYSSKSVGEGKSKKSKVSRKKRKITKKNAKFLEGLGLKVKQ